ncbi:hypothetical protein PHYBLDRAFT_131111 [Phycomyces blakesleeanus NRRL 1555(-)]|uniref:Conserved oligomeric Golgi complex subunit 3 n=1 Tax=Phycomyces blakesleeanus (strain ATCC 8743b / DSM 1359 / FGSC 10004 / NBRC 33097 / NRRL 1555) TaxID=763407 RepID=A0A167P743_PHYB8|nr:hypothetical protein PHYBLDRAFT_131111 [Phycomyces blakesleeanus NRRL 1555(-)]OAD77376.1 hypothetical protein PHYBLDRAFT_131111 [Phycomyces blakesleeanus NRRL 1555(-)]|eukprot:XP_018295416.1 hypothetical protein PHYBLDRAFT_131111 [Phycomyces blakesleeanus NRRL 1555(-)]
MEKDQEDIYRNYLSVVVLYREACDNFLEDLHGTLGVFGELGDEYAFVEQRTRALQTTCEELLQEQDRLTHLADALAERLAYFNHLEPIAKLFNSPGDDICLRPEFIGMLQTLDECIEYMQQHVSYRDSELYLMRFRQCMTRGMTLIKMYAVSTIKAVGYEIVYSLVQKTNDTSTNFGKQTNLFYVKFRAIAPTIKTLTGQLEKRCQGHKEYQALYQDILSAYFQTRQQLLSPVISRKIQQLGPSGGELAQNGCAYMMTLCSDEFNLFYNMFPSGEEDLYAYLDELTSYLYDHLRPRIIHENRIETLSELCGIFQVYIMQDDYQTGDEREGGHRLMFGNLIRNVLEDAQGKLVFRAQSFIHQDIQSYHPKPEDFELSKSIEASLLQMSELTDDTPHVTRRWYPALQNTLWILSKLYRCVQTGVFEDLAQEAVSLCSESLKRASDIITNTKSALDGQLFLIKHLLVLKEQLAPFEAELVHTGKELSFFPTTGALSSLQQNRSFFFNPNTLIGLAQSGMPRIVEISLDSRREVNFKLKDVCEEFITDCVSTAVDPLTVFMIKLSTMRPVGESSPDENGSPRAKTLSQEDVQSTVEQFKESAEERIRFVLRKLREYVNDYKMEQILIRPIELNILENYKNFYHTVTTESNGGKISTLDEPLPSVEYMSMWISQWKEEQSP